MNFNQTRARHARLAPRRNRITEWHFNKPADIYVVRYFGPTDAHRRL